MAVLGRSHASVDQVVAKTNPLFGLAPHTPRNSQIDTGAQVSMRVPVLILVLQGGHGLDCGQPGAPHRGIFLVAFLITSRSVIVDPGGALHSPGVSVAPRSL